MTSRSPIKMRPESTVSSPAIMRNEVVLPHPEGPTSTTNSPSPTLRSRWSTAGRRRTRIAPRRLIESHWSHGLPAQPGDGDAANEGALRNRVHEQQRQQNEDRMRPSAPATAKRIHPASEPVPE